MSRQALAVTGSTGKVGRLIAQHLADAGISQRLLAREPGKAPELTGASTVRCFYENTPESRAALTDIEVLFMVSAIESLERIDQHRTFIDAAVAAGVKHIVYLSFFGAASDATFTFARDHWATEQHIIESGVTHTFLRDNFYTDIFPHLVGEDGVIRGPAGDGSVAPVTRADVARVAATVLRNPGEHENQTYNLTGPEALTLAEIAEVFTEVTGREVTYYNETVEEAYESRRAWEAPQWEYDAWVSTYTAIAAGELAPATDDVQRVTGQAPESLRKFLS